jgi:hypothetical protein
MQGFIPGMLMIPCCTPTPMLPTIPSLQPCVHIPTYRNAMQACAGAKALHLLCKCHYCAEAACTYSTRYLACAEATLPAALTSCLAAQPAELYTHVCRIAERLCTRIHYHMQPMFNRVNAGHNILRNG